MSTNFYAHWRIGADSSYGAPVAFSTEVVLHIGKRSSNGFSMMNGAVFPTTAAWIQFLTHNANNVEIIDENNVVHAVADFIADELAVPDTSTKHINCVKAAGYTVHTTPVPTSNNVPSYWTDETGQMFYNGEFF